MIHALCSASNLRARAEKIKKTSVQANSQGHVSHYENNWKFQIAGKVTKVGGIRKIMVLWQAVFLAAPPSNLTRLYYNGSAAKSHSTSTQYRQLRRLVNHRTSRRTSGEWQDKTIQKKIYKSKNLKLYKET